MDNKILYTAKFTHRDLKFHKVWWKSDKRCGNWFGQTDRWTDRQTDRQSDSYIPPQTMFVEGIKINIHTPKHMFSIYLDSSLDKVTFRQSKLYFNEADVAKWSRVLDIRLSDCCCSVSMVWVQIVSREEQNVSSKT